MFLIQKELNWLLLSLNLRQYRGRNPVSFLKQVQDFKAEDNWGRNKNLYLLEIQITKWINLDIWNRGAHYIIGYPILTYISLYFCKLYYILYFSAYTIYSLDHHIHKLYGKWQESTWITQNGSFSLLIFDPSPASWI